MSVSWVKISHCQEEVNLQIHLGLKNCHASNALCSQIVSNPQSPAHVSQSSDIMIWIKSLALKILGWFDVYIARPTSFTQTMERNCSCHRCFCNFATKESALMTRGALIATLSGLQLRLHFEMLSMLHPSASSLFSERENPFCRRPLAGCCLKPLRPRLTDILQKYSETASAPHWDLVEWTMSPCHTLTGDFESLALFAPSWNGRCDEELARV